MTNKIDVSKMFQHTKNENGVLESIDDAPAIQTKNGTKMWYHDGVIHRLTGPALITATGELQWYVAAEKVTSKVTEWAAANGYEPKNMDAKDHELMWLALGLSFDSDNRPQWIKK